MPTISDGQLDRMRTQVNTLLPGTAVISSVSNASDGAGGWTPTWTPVTDGTVSCRIDPLTTRNQIAVEIGRETLTGLFQLTVPHDAPLAENRQVAIDSRTYEIIQIADVHSWNVSRRAIVSEVR